MASKSTISGHEIIYTVGGWIYADNGESVTMPRACKRCGQYPTQEGYDACLGHIQGAVSACCGHGADKPILMLQETKIIRHTTPEDILQSYFLGVPIGEIDSVGGYDIDGKDVGEMPTGEILENIHETGCWAFTNVNTGEVNVWVGDDVDMSLLVAMLSHEKAHLLPEKRNYPEEIADEMVAEEYSQVAVWAYEQALVLSSPANKKLEMTQGDGR